MIKVIVFDMGMSKGIITRGVTDGKIVDQHYVRVNGELYHAACIIKDTSEAQCALELVVKANQAAKDASSMASHLGISLLRHFKAI